MGILSGIAGLALGIPVLYGAAHKHQQTRLDRDRLLENNEDTGLTSMAETVTSTPIRTGNAIVSWRRQYTEECIPTGDEVCVFGRAEQRCRNGEPKNEDDILIAKGDQTLFKLSNRSDDGIME